MTRRRPATRSSRNWRRLAPNNKDTDRQLCLATCATRGVAWHHSALHVEEKAAIERAARAGLRFAACAARRRWPLA